MEEQADDQYEESEKEEEARSLGQALGEAIQRVDAELATLPQMQVRRAKGHSLCEEPELR